MSAAGQIRVPAQVAGRSGCRLESLEHLQASCAAYMRVHARSQSECAADGTGREASRTSGPRPGELGGEDSTANRHLKGRETRFSHLLSHFFHGKSGEV